MEGGGGEGTFEADEAEFLDGVAFELEIAQTEETAAPGKGLLFLLILRLLA